MKILFAITGSVAAIKAPLILEELSKFAEVRCIATKAALQFLPEGFPVQTDEDDQKWEKIGDPILHIELRRWADVLLIAPLTANSMTKLALGLCDNIVTNTFRAWERLKPVVLAPAMNCWMMENSRYYEHRRILKADQNLLLEPINKLLACGDTGPGAMVEVETIVESIKNMTLRSKS